MPFVPFARPRSVPPAALLALLLVALFALMAWQVAVDGPVAGADERLGNALRAGGSQPQPAQFLADLGGVAVALPVLAAALAASALLARRDGVDRWWLPALAGAAAMAAVPALVAPLKALTERAGPPGTSSAEGFFPSGHAATGVVAYGAVVLVLLPRLRGRCAGEVLAPWGLLTVLAPLSVLIGYGLVRCGYHWPLDVAGSWCLGGLLLLGVYVVLARDAGRGPRTGAGPCGRGSSGQPK